jgi:hypothetical protein
MAISNYQIPGVYVTQTQTALSSVSPASLNIAIVADQPVAGTTTDSFYTVIPASGITIGTLSSPMVNITSTGTYASYSGFTVTWVSGGTTVTGTYGVNFNINTTNGISYLTTSGVTAPTNALPSGNVNITYGHQWGAYGTYSSYNSIVNTIGVPVSGTTISNPATLAAYFAFLNGANTVSIMPVARVSSSGSAAATDSDWGNTFSVAASGTSSLPTQLANFTGVDVVVPLYGFTASGTVNTNPSGTVTSAIKNYLTVQYSYGNYQRFFIGVDGTSAVTSASSMQALAAAYNNTRVALSFPALLNFNPGLNLSTGLTNVTFNIPGYYLSAALAGLFAGQPTVATPITNKQVNGFNGIPNQISSVDAATNYLPYGVLTVRQKRDGNFWVLQGLTTNVSNWLTQEISINAIGDEIAKEVRDDLTNSGLIGSPLTSATFASASSIVMGTLKNAVSTGLIQAFQNLSATTNTSNPTAINITFQYSPTYPINYIQVTFSLNTQTGSIVSVAAPSNYTV